MAVRSLGSFFKKHKSIGLVVIDGIHFIENQDFLSQLERRQAKKDKGANKGQTTVEAMATLDVPTGDDFFGMDSKTDRAAFE